MLGEIVNKIEISNPKISIINYIDNPPNSTSYNMLEIVDSGANIHLSKQATPTMAPITMLNGIKARLPELSTVESTPISKLQLPGIIKKAR